MNRTLYPQDTMLALRSVCVKWGLKSGSVLKTDKWGTTPAQCHSRGSPPPPAAPLLLFILIWFPAVHEGGKSLGWAAYLQLVGLLLVVFTEKAKNERLQTLRHLRCGFPQTFPIKPQNKACKHYSSPPSNGWRLDWESEETELKQTKTLKGRHYMVNIWTNKHRNWLITLGIANEFSRNARGDFWI